MPEINFVHTVRPAACDVNIRLLVDMFDVRMHRQRMAVADVAVASVKTDLQPIILLPMLNHSAEASVLEFSHGLPGGKIPISRLVGHRKCLAPADDVCERLNVKRIA